MRTATFMSIDAGNNRVLRYPAPFAQTSDLLAVDLIIGQPDLNSNSANGGQTGPTASTLALANGGGVLGRGWPSMRKGICGCPIRATIAFCDFG